MNLKHLLETAPKDVKNTFIYKIHKKNTSILLADEENHYLYILIDGNADVIMNSYNGNMITISTYQAFSCFGELELFNESIKTCYVKSQSECEIILVPRYSVFNWMKADFEFTKYLIGQLSEKVTKSCNALTYVSLLNNKDRLLNNIYTHYIAGDLATLTKETICSETCIPLRSLYRAISECSSDGYFEYKEKHFQIISESKLELHCKSLIY